MERTADNQSATNLHLAKARDGIRAMNDWVVTHGPSETGSGSGIYGAAVAVMNELDAAVRLLTPAAEEPRIPCPFCRRMVASQASRCGYCWKRMIGPGK